MAQCRTIAGMVTIRDDKERLVVQKEARRLAAFKRQANSLRALHKDDIEVERRLAAMSNYLGIASQEAMDALKGANTDSLNASSADNAKVRKLETELARAKEQLHEAESKAEHAERDKISLARLYTESNSRQLDETATLLRVCDMLHADLTELCERTLMTNRMRRELEDIRDAVTKLTRHVEQGQRDNPLYESIEDTTSLDPEDVRRQKAAAKIMDEAMAKGAGEPEAGEEDEGPSKNTHEGVGPGDTGGLTAIRELAQEKAAAAREWSSDTLSGNVTDGVPIIRRADGSTGDLGVPLPGEADDEDIDENIEKNREAAA